MDTLFLHRFGKPLQFYIDPIEVSKPLRTSISKAIKLTGGSLAKSHLDAHIILVVKGTTTAYARARATAGKVVLDIEWVNACIAGRRLIGKAENWGGFRITVGQDEDAGYDDFVSHPNEVSLKNADRKHATLQPYNAARHSPLPPVPVTGKPSATSQASVLPCNPDETVTVAVSSGSTLLFVNAFGGPLRLYLPPDVQERGAVMRSLKVNGAILSKLSDCDYALLEPPAAAKHASAVIQAQKTAVWVAWANTCIEDGTLLAVDAYLVGLQGHSSGDSSLRSPALSINSEAGAPPGTFTASQTLRIRLGRVTTALSSEQIPVVPKTRVAAVDGKGCAFTDEDNTYFITYAAKRFRDDPSISLPTVLAEVALRLTHHSRAAWREHYAKHQVQFDMYIGVPESQASRPVVPKRRNVSFTEEDEACFISLAKRKRQQDPECSMNDICRALVDKTDRHTVNSWLNWWAKSKERLRLLIQQPCTDLLSGSGPRPLQDGYRRPQKASSSKMATRFSANGESDDALNLVHTEQVRYAVPYEVQDPAEFQEVSTSFVDLNDFRKGAADPLLGPHPQHNAIGSLESFVDHKQTIDEAVATFIVRIPATRSVLSSTSPTKRPVSPTAVPDEPPAVRRRTK